MAVAASSQEWLGAQYLAAPMLLPRAPSIALHPPITSGRRTRTLPRRTKTSPIAAVLAVLLLVAPVSAGAAGGEPCSAPGALSSTGPNILTIGDSISMCGYGYGHFVNDMLVQQTGGRLAGYSSACGQMASSKDGAAKMTKCIGNTSGTLKPQSFSVITYNAGLHDCDTSERVLPDAYRANVRAVLETLKPAAARVAFVTTTPYDMVSLPAGINMSCVLEYNAIAKEVASEVGNVTVIDLYAHVERFCQQQPSGTGWPPLMPDHNYSVCAIQSSGLHFFTKAPQPSGQQYTGLHIAAEATKLLPNEDINNSTDEVRQFLKKNMHSVLHTTCVKCVHVLICFQCVPGAPPLLRHDAGHCQTTPVLKRAPATMSCGNPPAPLSKTLPNVLIIGDSISEPGSGYGPGVEQLLMRPGIPWRNESGALAAVQHNGNTGSNQAGPTTNGVACIKGWLGTEKWDVIT